MEQRVLATASQAMRYVFKFMHCWRPFRSQLVVLIVCIMGAAVPGLAIPLFVQRILNEAYLQQNYRLLWVLFCAQIGLTVIGGVLSFVSSYVGTYIINRVEYGLCMRFYRAINHMPLPDVERRKKGEFVERTLSDIGTLANDVTDLWASVAQVLFTVAVAVYFMSRISYVATVLILLSSPLIYWVTVVASHKQRAFTLAGRQVAEALNTFMSETVEGSVEIRTYGFDRRMQGRLAEMLRQRVGIAFKMWRTRTAWKGLIQVIMSVWILGLSLGTWILLFKSRLRFGDVAALGIYVGVLFRPIQGIAGIYQSLIRVSVAAQRLLDLECNDQSPSELTAECEKKLSDMPREVEFQNVGFAYLEGKPCLSGLDLRFTAGERVAVVGANGSGKSTLLRILAGLDLRYTGEVYVDGVELRKHDPKDYRQLVSFVPQNVFMFRDSILNNLVTDGDHSRERVLQVAKEIGIDEMISNCPGGLDCIVDNGAWKLSGGQQKQLAMLRALLTPARIVLLDEPFANVDMETECRFWRQFQLLIPKDALVVMATHGGNSISDGWINRIIVMDKGRIIDERSPLQQSLGNGFGSLTTRGSTGCTESVRAD